ncbi:hypothetical protein AYI68_g2408 [Smittium mucronatum]|uniref:Uncharacterized protein n=1 Tax=Smittium mucronatum TaxID=133383 RepID=A0A1R0H2Z1_9FUNG|nr:hypothetical protein AYI68_g2408 [Smittium mucronatum]
MYLQKNPPKIKIYEYYTLFPDKKVGQAEFSLEQLTELTSSNSKVDVLKKNYDCFLKGSPISSFGDLTASTLYIQVDFPVQTKRKVETEHKHKFANHTNESNLEYSEFIKKLNTKGFESLIPEMCDCYRSNIISEDFKFKESQAPFTKPKLFINAQGSNQSLPAKVFEPEPQKLVPIPKDEFSDSDAKGSAALEEFKIPISVENIEYFSPENDMNATDEKEFKKIIEKDDQHNSLSEMYTKYNSLTIIYKIGRGLTVETPKGPRTLDNFVYKPGYMVIHDTEKNSLVLAIKGTSMEWGVCPPRNPADGAMDVPESSSKRAGIRKQEQNPKHNLRGALAGGSCFVDANAAGVHLQGRNIKQRAAT